MEEIAKPPWLQTLVNRAVPLAAGVVWLAAWKGPFDEALLNFVTKSNALMILIYLFVSSFPHRTNTAH